MTLPRGAHIVEIGTDCGRSALFLASRLLAHGNDKARIYTIDPWWFEPDRPLAAPRGIRGPKLRVLVGAATDEELHLIYPLRAESPGVAKLFDDASLALVFIDGAHDIESVRADIRAWKPKIRPGGLLAGHDYSLAWPGVRRAVSENLSAYEVRQTVWWSKLDVSVKSG
jgi:predicted O-methyltransferase YrrM